MGILKSCKPRAEVMRGDLDDAIFAADFGYLVQGEGKSPKVYSDPKTFFQNTHPAKQLCQIVEAIFGRLSDPKEAGACVRLSTGFGGGKTHTLMALWHLANNIGNSSLGTDLLPAAGRPKEVKVVAIDAGKAGIPIFASHGKVKTHSLWGELFYKLGGEKALKSLEKADDPEASPSDDQIASAFPSKTPVLILLDEIVIYMAKLSDRGHGNLLGFLGNLASVVGSRPQSVLVVTDPRGQYAYAQEAASINAALANRLDDILDRKFSDFDPIGDEAAQVIVRRLFEKVDGTAAQSASANYLSLYQRVLQDSSAPLPASASNQQYAKEIVRCYPFHPRLLATTKDRLGVIQDFQKSRGVLRLFARILRDLWDSKEDCELITAGDINWLSPRIQADLLDRLSREEFKAAVSADIEKHAAELDGGTPDGIHSRVASALLLESLPMEQNSGLDPAELTLAVLKPDEAGPEPEEALDRLISICWHTYPMPGGRGWQFRYQPNVIKQIEERMGDIAVEDARNRVMAEAQGYFSGPALKVSPWPSSARAVPETADLQLVLCEDEKMAKHVCANHDDSDPKAPMPRAFRNSILAIAPTPSSLHAAVEHAQRLIAAEAIEKDYRKGESGKLIREQLQRVLPEYQKRFRIQTCRAFDKIILAGGMTYTLDEQYQVSEDEILKKAKGQACIRRFLDEKGLIYQSDDTMDVNRFMTKILPGATPTDKPSVYTAKAIHERFLSAPDLRLIPDAGIVRKTIVKATEEGKIVVQLSGRDTYDDKGSVQGPQGMRRRISGVKLPPFPLDTSVLVAPSNSEWAKIWTKEDQPTKPGEKGKPVPPPPPPDTTLKEVTVPQIEEAVKTADERPLKELKLSASTPSDGGTLQGVAQPLGADSLKFMVAVSGAVKGGGMLNFMVNEVKPTHAIEPLKTAERLFNGIEAGGSYEAELTLSFGRDGRAGMSSALETLGENVSDGVKVVATFGKKSGS